MDADSTVQDGGIRPSQAQLVKNIYLVIFCIGTLAIYLYFQWFNRNFFKFIRFIYDFWTLYFPALAVFGAGAGVFHWLGRGDREWRRVALLGLFAVVGGFGVRIYATHIEPHRLQLREVTIESPKISQPVRILHISDIQTTHIGRYEERAFEMMRELHPDLVVHTGDLLQDVAPEDWKEEYGKLTALFQSLKPPLGIVNVFGDVDDGLHNILLAKGSPIPTLEDSATTITTAAGDMIAIYGLSLHKSHHEMFAREPVKAWFDALTPDAFSLVIGHGPNYTLALHDLPIDLCLAGHTHGGQVRPPFNLPPPITFSHIDRRHARGFHEIGKTRLNVSAGIGAEHAAGLPSIRFLCPPEMTLITLVPARSALSQGPS